MPLDITSPIDGAILNHQHGHTTEEGLLIPVKGECVRGSRLTVNDQPATVKGTTFEAVVCLDRQQNAITAASGGSTHSITVLYDRNSYRRYRFSLDDDIWFLRDIAQQRYRSIFETPYMALWRRLHEEYGTKVNCNIYYQFDDFNLTMMPDVYRSEWRDNADWFRLTFHALQNEPSEPYIHATYDQVAHDYDLIANEILRFAGEESMNTFTTIHWGEAPVEACRAVRDRGIKGLCGYFVVRDGTPKVSYYLDREHTEYIAERDYWKDMEEGLIFVRHAMVINSFKLPDVVPVLEATAAKPHQGEVLELMIHEQYFYPHYVAYIPDYAERCETAVRWVTDNGYRPVFYSDGFIGAPEWRPSA